jgi:hypothetical protein
LAGTFEVATILDFVAFVALNAALMVVLGFDSDFLVDFDFRRLAFEIFAAEVEAALPVCEEKVSLV